MRVRRSVVDATYVVQHDDGAQDVVGFDDRPERAAHDSPVAVNVEERLDVSAWALALVAVTALIAIVAGVAVTATDTGGLTSTLALLGLVFVPAAVADGYTRLRDRDDDPLAAGVLHESSEPVAHWLVGALTGIAVLAVAPGRLRLVAAGWLALLLLVLLVGPLRRAGHAISAWLHGQTVVSESRATFPGDDGTPFGGGVKGSLAEAEAETEMRLLPTFVGEWTAGDARCQYQFTFASVEGGTEVVQRVALRRSVWAMQVLVVPALTAGLLWAGWLAVDAGVGQAPGSLSLSAMSQVWGIARQALIASGVFAAYVAVVGPTMVRLSRRPNLLAEVQELGDRYLRVETTFDAVLLTPAGACLLLGVFRGEERLLALSGGFLACQILVVAVGVADGRPLLWLRRGVAELVGGTPIAARYARALGLTMLPLAAIGVAQFALGPQLGDTVTLPAMDLLATGCLCLFAASVAVNLATEAFGAGYHAARRKSMTPATVAVGLAVVAACSVATYAALGYVLELWVLDGLLPFNARPYSAFRLSLTTATLLFLTVPAGAVTQAIVDVRGRLGPPAAAERLTTDPATRIGAPVYVLDSDAPFSEVSGTYGGDPYIVISTEMLSKLGDDGEIAAVLAHEQAHIDHGDTTLGLVLPLISVLTLTGQNVLFDLFDVPEREHRADIAAARSLDSPDPLLSAFDSLDDLPERAQSDRPAGTGTLGALPVGEHEGSALSLLARPFRLFFGRFALTDVHPSVDARRERVRVAFDAA
jgi:Zn-dependent protease with chaperone function